MADNFLENQYNDYLKKKAAKSEARKVAWRKRLKAYQESLKAQKADSKKP